MVIVTNSCVCSSGKLLCKVTCSNFNFLYFPSIKRDTFVIPLRHQKSSLHFINSIYIILVKFY